MKSPLKTNPFVVLLLVPFIYNGIYFLVDYWNSFGGGDSELSMHSYGFIIVMSCAVLIIFRGKRHDEYDLPP